jgi:tetratricopeptide (TPR) repeat protein
MMRRTGVFLLLVLVAAVGCESRSSLVRGVDLFLGNQIDEAVPHLERAARQMPRAADPQAWLAEALRRLERFEEAEAAARRVLAVDPCHAFAHQVLADLYNPMYGRWPSADEDSAWTHIRQAVACDSTDANIWTSAWVQALSRGDTDLERQSVRRMVHTGFLTPAVLEYTRWILRSLPERAILLCNGDLDTYPAVALQETEGLRLDVAVVNLPLLNTTWYRRMVRDRLHVPLTPDDVALDALGSQPGPQGDYIYADRRIVVDWLESLRDGGFPRPLAAAITVPTGYPGPEADGRIVLSGPFRLYRARPVDSDVDTAATRESFAHLDRDALSSPFVSPKDRSPVRREGDPVLHDNVAHVAFLHTAAVVKSGDAERAQAAVDWALDVARETGASAEAAQRIEELSPAGQEAPGR